MLKKRPASAVAAKTGGAIEVKKEAPPHPKQALMDRLASGKRVEISTKQMHKLTSKNYNELPEVKRKREEEAKKEEMLRRKQQVKEEDRKRR